jgi:hypothetical protein
VASSWWLNVWWKLQRPFGILTSDVIGWHLFVLAGAALVWLAGEAILRLEIGLFSKPDTATECRRCRVLQRELKTALGTINELNNDLQEAKEKIRAY